MANDLLLLTVTRATRLDKALAEAASASDDPRAAGLSRSGINKLILSGQVSCQRQTSPAKRFDDPSQKVKPLTSFLLRLPPPTDLRPRAEPMSLDIIYEDEELLVVDKPAGMVAHPAPGSESGCLVNGLLHHCGRLSSLGGESRPGIVHRLDKGTSGLLVIAKTDRAYLGLASQFAAHSVERSYRALLHGIPARTDRRLVGLPSVSFEGEWIIIDAPIARSRTDRKKMAIARSGGKRALTRIRPVEIFDVKGATCSWVKCRLETGRTHQIRVHCRHIGHPVIGDQTYGRNMRGNIFADFPRMALHAKSLGFTHPISGKKICFTANLPDQIEEILEKLRLAAISPSCNANEATLGGK